MTSSQRWPANIHKDGPIACQADEDRLYVGQKGDAAEGGTAVLAVPAVLAARAEVVTWLSTDHPRGRGRDHPRGSR